MNYYQFRAQLLHRKWVLGTDNVWRNPKSAQLTGVGVPDSEITDIATNHGDLLQTMILNQIDVGAKGWNKTVTQNGLQIQTNLQLFLLMIPPRDDYILVLRRIPWDSTIPLQELVDLVWADLDLCLNKDALSPIAYGDRPLFGWSQVDGVKGFLKILDEQDYINIALERYVSLTERTKTELTFQPGIKKRAEELPMSPRGLLTALAREADE